MSGVPFLPIGLGLLLELILLCAAPRIIMVIIIIMSIMDIINNIMNIMNYY